MFRQYLKQGWQIIKTNPLVSTISILGSAIAISMIMVCIFVVEIRVFDFAPDVNRSRSLYIRDMEARKDEQNYSKGMTMSPQVVKEIFYQMQVPEMVSAGTNYLTRSISLPGKTLYKGYSVKLTDPAFWKIFRYNFIKGGPFSESDFESGLPVAVVAESLAREIFGTTDVLNEVVLFENMEYRIIGVVKDVSKTSRYGYGQFWAPYTSYPPMMNSEHVEGIQGPLGIVILARSMRDRERINRELDQLTNQYNNTKSEWKINFGTGPITRYDDAISSTNMFPKSWWDFFKTKGLLFIFLLIVPALNLSGVTQASIQQRRDEMGLRKSFGATDRILIYQVLSENLVTTMLGGLLGLVGSFGLMQMAKQVLFPVGYDISVGMLFHPLGFLTVLFFIVLLNLLSALIPALRITRQPITESLKGKE